MIEPILTSIATALAGKTTAVLTAAGRKALSALYELVKNKFSDDKTSAEVLANTKTDSSEEQASKLAAELAKMTNRDPVFAEQLRQLWGEASAEIHAESDAVVNQVSGKVVGHLMQARDIVGNINFGSLSTESAAIPPQRENVSDSAATK